MDIERYLSPDAKVILHIAEFYGTLDAVVADAIAAVPRKHQGSWDYEDLKEAVANLVEGGQFLIYNEDIQEFFNDFEEPPYMDVDEEYLDLYKREISDVVVKMVKKDIRDLNEIIKDSENVPEEDFEPRGVIKTSLNDKAEHAKAVTNDAMKSDLFPKQENPVR